MKKLSTIISGLLLLSSIIAQSPMAFQYQAVVRDNAGNLINGQDVDFRIDILEGAVDGTTVYSETHSAITTTRGMVTLTIGSGATSDDFSTIGWGSGSYFIKLWVDGDEMGTTQLLSVPYALHASRSDTAGTFDILTVKGDTPCNVSTRGAMRYNGNTNSVEYCNGNNWIAMSSGLSIGLPQITTSSIEAVSTNSAASGGTIVSNGGGEIFEKGICWNISGNPVKSDQYNREGSGSEAFFSYMEGLTSFELYYVRAFATNTAGTGYGEELSFRTDPQLAGVSTEPATFIDYSSFSTGGTVVLAGKETVQKKGIVYGTHENPTESDHFIEAGSGTGTFSVDLTNLEDTLYYYRAYAKNEAGLNYGEEKSYTKHVTFQENKIMVMPTTSGAVSFVNFSEDSQYEPIAISREDGENNTTLLLSRFGSDAEAAYMCDTLTAYGYTDWYLPARDELHSLSQFKEALGNSITATQYWSSTERSNNDWQATAWAENFDSKNSFYSQRTTIFSVVCVRRGDN